MFKLVVVILCFATLLVSTGSALKKDEYEINIKHGTFAVHQLHVNADREGTSRSVPLAPTIAPGSASKENVQLRNEQFFGAANAERGSAGAEGSDGVGVGGERISTTLAASKPTVQSDVLASVIPIKSIDFNAVSPGLEEVPLQENIFQSSQGRGQNRILSYQSVEYYPPEESTAEQEAIVKPISAQDFYNTPQLRERGPVLFATEATTTTTTSPAAVTVKPPGKVLKSIPKTAVDENEEIYLLLKYENPRQKVEGSAQTNENNRAGSSDKKKVSESRENLGTFESLRIKTAQQNTRNNSGTRKRPQIEEGRQPEDFLPEGLRAGGSFTTVGYFVSDSETTTPMTPVSTSSKSTQTGSTPATEAPARGSKVRFSPSKLRNSYGDYLSADFKDFEDSIRPIEENVDETPEDETEQAEQANEEESSSTAPVDIDANMDIMEMARILAGRQGGLTIAEFNRLFKDYLKKEFTVEDLEGFKKLENAQQEETKEEPAKQDPTKSFDIRAANGKNDDKKSTSLPGPTAAQKHQLDAIKVFVNKPPFKYGRKDPKVVKIGYGGSKSYQGVYKSHKFLEKVKSERGPLPSDGLWGGLEYRQAQPVREIGPMAYVDNPVFGFIPNGARPRAVIKDGPNGGQSYVKFQKIS